MPAARTRTSASPSSGRGVERSSRNRNFLSSSHKARMGRSYCYHPPMPASPYLLGTDAGMSPAVSGLIGMLRYARTTTVHAVSGLTMAQLDHRHDGESNSIAMLLAHIAAVEAWYQAASFDGRDWTAAEAKRWNIAADLGPAAAKVIRARALESYLDDLASVR